MFPRLAGVEVHVRVPDLAGLVQREVETVRAVGGVGGKYGVGGCEVVAGEVVWGVWFVGVCLVARV